MFKGLSPGAIGVKFNNLAEAVAGAKRHGFGGVEISPAEVADLIDLHSEDHVKKIFEVAGIKPAGFGMPVDWRNANDTWQRDLGKLPRWAKAAATIGANRTFTWIMPCSNDRPFDENYRFHVERLKPVAGVLAEFGIDFGLEFIGPKTLWASQKFEFIHTLGDMLKMAAEIGPNVGLLLDCWHWYTSNGTLDEIKSLQPKQVVYVHVNDAPKGIEIDQQMDHTRDLPGATGVIDIKGFLQALKNIGYDGPITPEPFKKDLSELPGDEDRLKTVAASMDKIFKQAGVK